jgi:hypothetical protein
MDESENLTPDTETPATEPVVSTQAEQPAHDARPSGGSTEAAGSPWLNDESREFYKSYGLSDDELSGFQSKDEADRLARILDRQYASFGEAARKAAQPAAAKPAEMAPAQPAPAATPAAAPTFTRVDIARLKAAGYDDETIAELARPNQAFDALERLEKERAAERAELSEIKQHFTSWQQYQQEQQQQRLFDAVHQAIDGMNDDKFGKAFGDDGRAQQFTNEQWERRQKIYQQAEILAAGHASQGLPVPSLPSLLRRANQMVFGGEIAAQARAAVHQDIQKQSAQRRPVATQPRDTSGRFAEKPANPFNLNEYVSQVANSPDLVAQWNRIQQESGAAV